MSNTMEMRTNKIHDLKIEIAKLKTREENIPAEILKYFEDNPDDFVPVAEALDSYNGFLDDDRCYSMDEFDEFFCGCSALEIAQKVCGGDFNPYNDYFYFTIYGVESTNYPDYSDHIDDYAVDEIIDNRSEVEYDLPDEIIDLLDELDEIPYQIEEIEDEIDELEAELDETA